VVCSVVGGIVLVGALGACGDGADGDDDAGAGTDCPTYADVSAAPDGDGVKDFAVTLDLALMNDAEERADRLASVGGPLCLSVTEERPLALDSVVVDAGRPLDAEGQRLLSDALLAVDGVQDVRPAPPSTPAG
jgi:hypothetical protein